MSSLLEVRALCDRRPIKVEQHHNIWLAMRAARKEMADLERAGFELDDSFVAEGALHRWTYVWPEENEYDANEWEVTVFSTELPGTT